MVPKNLLGTSRRKQTLISPTSTKRPDIYVTKKCCFFEIPPCLAPSTGLRSVSPPIPPLTPTLPDRPFSSVGDQGVAQRDKSTLSHSQRTPVVSERRDFFGVNFFWEYWHQIPNQSVASSSVDRSTDIDAAPSFTPLAPPPRACLRLR